MLVVYSGPFINLKMSMICTFISSAFVFHIFVRCLILWFLLDCHLEICEIPVGYHIAVYVRRRVKEDIYGFC